MKNHTLRLPGEVHAGEFSVSMLSSIVKDNFGKVVIFTDKGVKNAGLLKGPLKELEKAEIFSANLIDDISSEPTYLEVQEIINRCQEFDADLIIAIGGGSVMDVAKLASVCSGKNSDLKEIMQHSDRAVKTVKTLMIPTTAGTGSEATPNAIVTVPEKELKVGIVSQEMIADYVILDGEMIRNIPRHIAASTGIDALSHALECYTSNKATPFSHLFSLEAAKLIFENLLPACESTEAMEAKNKMLLASFYAGVAISASGTTAVHALSYPLGGKYHIPHGISNAIMLLPVMKFNVDYCIREFSEIHDVLNINRDKSGKEKSDWVLARIETIVKTLDIPQDLSSWNVSRNDLEDLVEAGMSVERLLVNNKRKVMSKDARELYLEVLGGGSHD